MMTFAVARDSFRKSTEQTDILKVARIFIEGLAEGRLVPHGLPKDTHAETISDLFSVRSDVQLKLLFLSTLKFRANCQTRFAPHIITFNGIMPTGYDVYELREAALNYGRLFPRSASLKQLERAVSRKAHGVLAFALADDHEAENLPLLFHSPQIPARLALDYLLKIVKTDEFNQQIRG